MINYSTQMAQSHIDVFRDLVNQADSYRLLAGKDLEEKPWLVEELITSKLM